MVSMPMPVFVSSLKDEQCEATSVACLPGFAPQVVLNATGFAISSPGSETSGTVLDETGAIVPAGRACRALGRDVARARRKGSTRATWQ